MAARPSLRRPSSPATRRPATAPAGRNRNDSERTTAIYLSLSLHAVVATTVLIGHFTRPDPPDLALHQDVEILSIEEFDPLWRGRQLIREPLDTAPGAVPVETAGAVSDPAPPARTPGRPAVVSREADRPVARLPETATPENAREVPATDGAAATPVEASEIEQPAPRRERDRARPVRIVQAIRSIPAPAEARRAPIADPPVQAREDAVRPDPGSAAGAPAGVPEIADRPVLALSFAVPTRAPETVQPQTPRPIAKALAPVPEAVQDAPQASSIESRADPPVQAREDAVRPDPGSAAGAPAGAPEIADRPVLALSFAVPTWAPETVQPQTPRPIAKALAPVPEAVQDAPQAFSIESRADPPVRAREDAVRPDPGSAAGAPAGAPEIADRPVRALSLAVPTRAPETVQPQTPRSIAKAPAPVPEAVQRPPQASSVESRAEAPKPVRDRPASAREDDAPRRAPSVDVAAPVPRPIAAPSRAGEVVLPNRRQAPAATLEGLSPTGGRGAAAVEASRDRAQGEATGPSSATERRRPAAVEAGAAPHRRLRATAERASAIELSFRETGIEAPVGSAVPEAVSGANAVSIPTRTDAARLLQGLLPFPWPALPRPAPPRIEPAETVSAAIGRPDGSPRPAPERSPPADLRKISELLAEIRCGRLSGDLDEASGTLRLDGHVASLSERARIYGALARLEGVTEIRDGATVILPPPLCQVLDTLRNAGLTASKAHQIRPRMLAQPTQAGIQRFGHGERIVVRLTTPRWPAWVYVDFYDLHGRVTHLIPNPRVRRNRFEPGSVLSIGDDGSGTALRAGAPYGANILVAIGASRPLFGADRPRTEAADDYLAELGGTIASLRRAGAPIDEEYVYVFIITEDIAQRRE